MATHDRSGRIAETKPRKPSRNCQIISMLPTKAPILARYLKTLMRVGASSGVTKSSGSTVVIAINASSTRLTVFSRASGIAGSPAQMLNRFTFPTLSDAGNRPEIVWTDRPSRISIYL